MADIVFDIKDSFLKQKRRVNIPLWSYVTRGSASPPKEKNDIEVCTYYDSKFPSNHLFQQPYALWKL